MGVPDIVPKVGGGSDYRAARQALLEAEIALRDQIEAVAQQRRALPLGPAIEKEYVFDEGAPGSKPVFTTATLADLFDPGCDSLIVIHFMFEPGKEACPMCSMWADTYNAAARHIRQKTALALVAKAPIGELVAWAQKRGWHQLRLLSSFGNTFNADFHMEDKQAQYPGLSVFKKDNEGAVHHFYTACALMSADKNRGIDLMSPVWNMFDLLPEGRENWLPQRDYDAP